MSVHFKEPELFEIEGEIYTFKRLKLKEPQQIIGYVKNLYLLAMSDLESYAERFPTFRDQIVTDLGRALELAFSSEYVLNYALDFINTKLVRIENDQRIDVNKEDFENLPPAANVILLEQFYNHPDLLTFREKVLGLKDHPLVKGLVENLAQANYRKQGPQTT